MARQNRNTPTTQPELICTFCSRAFENKKQTSRHVRYCRTKAKDGVSTRRKSCAACIKAKTRCEMTVPNCTRCTNKGIQCLYRSSDGEMQGVSGDGPIVDQRQMAVPHSDLLEQAAPDSSHVSRQSFAGNNFDCTLSTSTLPEVMLPPGSNSVDMPTFSNGLLDLDSLSWNYPPDIFLRPQIYQFKDRIVLGNFYLIDISLPGACLDTKTILEKRDVRAGPLGSALSRAYCMTTLRSYPGMLCSDGGTLPPFVHAQAGPITMSQTASNNGVVLSEPLQICSSIMRMYMAKTPGNLPFIWRTIGAESQRIEDNYHSWDTWKILASVQAMTVYLILGLLDDDSEYVPDGRILRSMCNITRKIAEKLFPILVIGNEELPQDQLPTWEDWALSECRRRTGMIIVILIHLFNIGHGACLPPCGGFADLPLPCSKKLWQAADQETWEKEYRKEYMQNDSNGGKPRTVPTYRDLLPDLQDLGERMGWLSEWFLGMDEVGTLVTMAVSTL